MILGEPLPTEGDVELNENRQTASLTVANTGDRPIQVGSHFHFFETNKALRFDHESAFGMRLDVPAGSSVRFEPGDEREVDLVSIGGRRVVHGFSGLTEGSLDEPRTSGKRRSGGHGRRALWRRRDERYIQAPLRRDVRPDERRSGTVGRYGADSTGRREPHARGRGGYFRGRKVHPGEDGAGTDDREEGAMGLVVTNALILDHSGIIKADIGVRDGRIAGIGKAGNPDTMDGVTLEIEASTEIIAGEGLFVTAAE